MVGQERCKVRTVDVTFEAGLPFIYIYIYIYVEHNFSRTFENRLG